MSAPRSFKSIPFPKEPDFANISVEGGEYVNDMHEAGMLSNWDDVWKMTSDQARRISNAHKDVREHKKRYDQVSDALRDGKTYKIEKWFEEDHETSFVPATQEEMTALLLEHAQGIKNAAENARNLDWGLGIILTAYDIADIFWDEYNQTLDHERYLD